jgi:hypothetical protein
LEHIAKENQSMRFENTFDKHRAEQDKSFKSYLTERRLALGQSIGNRHKIYLDTKYWILLRDHTLGRSTDAGIKKLAGLLHDGVKSTKLICKRPANPS